MAQGALRHSDANIASAKTGVAGPDNSAGNIPAGTVCFGRGFRRYGKTGMYSETRHFAGDRHAVRWAAAGHAIRRIPGLYAEFIKAHA